MFLFNMDGESTLCFADLSGLKVFFFRFHKRLTSCLQTYIYIHVHLMFLIPVCVYKYMLCKHSDFIFLLQFLEV